MILSVFIVLGVLATIIFVAGYTRGVRLTLLNRYISEQTTTDNAAIETEKPVGLAILLAVIASGVMIALAGAHHLFLYLGPLLVIVTAIGNGYAFFYESCKET